VCVVCLLFLVLLKRRANKAKENDELSQSGNMTELGGGPVYAGASSLPDTGGYGANVKSYFKIRIATLIVFFLFLFLF